MTERAEIEGIQASVNVIQHQNGYLVELPSSDYGRLHYPGWIFHDLESAITQALQEIEDQIREKFNNPTPATAPAASVGGMIQGSPTPAGNLIGQGTTLGDFMAPALVQQQANLQRAVDYIDKTAGRPQIFDSGTER